MVSVFPFDFAGACEEESFFCSGVCFHFRHFFCFLSLLNNWWPGKVPTPGALVCFLFFSPLLLLSALCILLVRWFVGVLFLLFVFGFRELLFFLLLFVSSGL